MVKIFDLIDKVKDINPLILHYTNNVTITDCANATLAIGEIGRASCRERV